MDHGTLRVRLWANFGRLQTLLGSSVGEGRVIEREGLLASIVPGAPESPTLNAAVALEPGLIPEHLRELEERYRAAGVRRWGVWLDASATLAARALYRAGLSPTAQSPGMGAEIDELDSPAAPARDADLTTVGRVNDLAYGNHDRRLERTLAPLPNGVVTGFRADLQDGSPGAVALAQLHDHDCGISFVATVPRARRKGLATNVMQQALAHARARDCTTTTLQATEVGERLYEHLGYRRLCDMQLWERRR
jgi:ribosomal protein S18 acetylase RimI-like enzyme